MKAVIMAGGEGSRLRPLTCDIPKPMVPILNRPVMEHIINLLKKHGIKDIAATLAYLPQKISSYFDTGENFGVNMAYFTEEKPLGTAGSVKNASDFLNEDFLVISGDALTDINLSKAIEFHKNNNAIATLVLKRVKVPLEYGVVVTAKDGHIIKFLEKPSWGEVISDTVNTGIYILSPKVFSYYPESEKCDFAQDIFPRLLSEGLPVFGYVTDEYWCDIGDINAYSQANKDALNGIVNIEYPGFEFFKGVWLGKDCVIDEQVILSPRCIIGDGCIIKTGAHISENSIIGNHVTIGENTSVKNSIIWDGANIGAASELRGALICENTSVDKRTRIFESAIVGSQCKIGSDASIKPKVKIWPGKTVDSGSEISGNIVWGSGEIFNSKKLFGNRGISGTIGIEFNPAIASDIGCAFAASLSPSSSISVAHDGSAPAEAASLAFISGAASFGANCINCGELSLPMLRFTVREYCHKGAAYISSAGDRISLILLDANGCDISRKTEKKVAAFYQKHDMPFAEYEDIKHIVTLENIKEQYTASYQKSGITFNSPMTVAISGDPRIKKLAQRIFINGGLKVCDLSSGKYDLAVTFSSDGENFDLYDERGVLMEKDSVDILISTILFETCEKCAMAIPVSKSSVYDELAEKYGSSILRTGNSAQDIMEKISNDIIRESADIQLSMRYDAIFCVFRIMAYMQKKGSSLSNIKAQLPGFYIKSEDIDCSFDRKGLVMRNLFDETDGKVYETIDGIKIYCDKGWVLILPDSERPVFRITAEGMKEEYAQELLIDYNKK